VVAKLMQRRSRLMLRSTTEDLPMSLLHTLSYTHLFCTLLLCFALLFGATLFDEFVLSALARMRRKRLNLEPRKRQQLASFIPIQSTRLL
jgi:hypothetical protein